MNDVLTAAVTLSEPSVSTVVDDIEASARRTLALAQQLRSAARTADD